MNFKKIIPYLTIFFLCLVAYLLYDSLSSIEWSKVRLALQEISIHVFLTAFGIVLINYFILVSYDIIAIRFFKLSKISILKIIPSAFVCYVFNLNLGALVGALGFRYRIYTGWGIDKKKVPILFALSTITNWSGYLLLLSILLVTNPEVLLKFIEVPVLGLRILGMLVAIILLIYLFLCLKEKKIRFSGKEFQLPSLKIGLLQLILSSLQWISISSIIFYFLHYLNADIRFEQVLFTHLVASIAGVITHIPAGLGVLETVFLRMKTGVASEDLLVALVGLRIVYYLIPLLLAVPLYLGLEIYQKKKQ